ncbi:tetratricopeptide repeat protein [Nocardiopsis sp. MG754419]|uniref:tetratricopeptide repeat protein n=1 Tax=Nocardiopsis sp. MG754419 TaxID=2259865 RepID=UPI0035AE65BA
MWLLAPRHGDKNGPVPIPEPVAHFQPREHHPPLDEEQVLTGSAGTGKTQAAAHHARALLSAAPDALVVWADATSRDGVVFAYAHAARRLLDRCPDDPELAAGRFLSWWSEPPQGVERRRLVVWDHLTDPDACADLWPATGHDRGRMIVTTRLSRADLSPGHRPVVEVGPFTEAEARGYLRAALTEARVPHTLTELTALAEVLDRHPLALGQAVAYMADRRTSCAAYLELIADSRDAREPALARADRHRPIGVARPLMGLISLLSPLAAPEQVLVSRPFRTHLGRRVYPPRRLAEHEVRLALASLERLHLITRDTPLVIAAHDHPHVPPGQESVRTAADGLMTVWPDTCRGAPLEWRLLASTETLRARAPEGSLWDVEPHPLLFRTRTPLWAGAAEGPLPYREMCLEGSHRALEETYERHLVVEGPDGPTTLRARYSLAYLRAWAGDLTGATVRFRHLLHDLRRWPGADRPEVLCVRGALTLCRADAGDPIGAAADARRLLEEQRARLGPDHPSTLITLHNLAHWRGAAGDARGAVEDLERLAGVHAEVSGADDPATLRCRHDLACRRARAGEPARAARELELVWRDRRRVLGPDHPDTVATRRRWERLLRERRIRAEEERHGVGSTGTGGAPTSVGAGAEDDHGGLPGDEPTGPRSAERLRG